MGIRKAKEQDASAIRTLLEQLGYPTPDGLVESKLSRMLDHPDERLFVYEEDNAVIAVMSLHFVPQLALIGDFATISYFVVDETIRSKGIGKAMEEHCTALAIERGCEKIQVHSNIRRTKAHQFYERQGFQESSKDFFKKLN
ncbi:GNAT family N-acetyltransferase [Pedobacter sp. L105]|uniref:GNAT family N-acetyltransferase n=1 Tax=Pedobacter sp. L105 TaxID=1641871 RepID=UPI00131E45EA|nr:GNAT family N-acetyltransferase [Pedobacter sp. L105]